MKKGFKVNKAAGILDIVYASLVMFVGIMMLFYLMIVGSLVSGSVGAAGGAESEVDAAFGTVGVIVLTIVCALSVVHMVFGIKTLKFANASQQEYYASKSTLLVFAIIESVLLAISFAGIASSPEFATVPFMLIALIVLRWIGFSYCQKGEKENQEQTQVVETTTLEAPQQTTESETKRNNDNMFESLEKLNKLRLDGAITQEEFDQMKKKIIE